MSADSQDIATILDEEFLRTRTILINLLLVNYFLSWLPIAPFWNNLNLISLSVFIATLVYIFSGFRFTITRKKYSEETARAIDDEVRRILEEAHTMAQQIIDQYKEQVELLTQMLMEFETLDSEDVQEIVIKKTWDINRKKERLKKAAELHKKEPNLPPPPPPKEAINPMNPNNPGPVPGLSS